MTIGDLDADHHPLLRQRYGRFLAMRHLEENYRPFVDRSVFASGLAKWVEPR